MKFILKFFFLLSLLSPLCANDHRPILGYSEWVSVECNKGIIGLVDSGASQSSIHCTSYEINKKGKNVTLFFVVDHPMVSSPFSLEVPLSRYILVRQANTDRPMKRAVVLLNVSVRGVLKNVEFNLVDRSHMTYPLLLGRNFLEDSFYIDPSKSVSLP